MTTLRVERCAHWPRAAIEDLAVEAKEEGFRFLRRLIDEWEAGSNRFAEPGEAFFLAFSGSRVVGTCGLSRDPFVEEGRVGRLRRLFVASDWRRHGLASWLTLACIQSGHSHFERVRLRTDDAGASAFYRRRGFSAIQDAEATHELVFDLGR